VPRQVQGLPEQRLRFCHHRLPPSSQQISALGSQNFGRAPTGLTPLRASDGVRTCQLFSDCAQRIEDERANCSLQDRLYSALELWRAV
jgi:hypothetical protein